jgi:serine/threonine protein kinase
MNDGAYERVGEYEILEHLGAGGMGDVYKVQHVISSRIEAMKLIRRELLGNRLAEERFLREIRVLAELNHPNIARLLTATEIDGSVAMIMEFVQGSTIERLLKDGPLSVEETNYYASQMLSALAYAHGRDVVHRDIKPANCMVTIDEGLVKVMDFGLARSMTQRKLTEDGSTSGTFDYMPPEQIAGGKVDARTDLYALGVTMFEMVTGEVLFSHSDGLGAIIRAHQTERPRAPIAMVPSIPLRLNDIILKLLEKKPEDRYQSAEKVLEALNGVSGKITASRAATAVRRTTEIDAAVHGNGRTPRDGLVGRTPTSNLRGGDSANRQVFHERTVDMYNTPVPASAAPPPLPHPRMSWTAIVLGCVAMAAVAGGGVYVAMHRGDKGDTATSKKTQPENPQPTPQPNPPGPGDKTIPTPSTDPRQEQGIVAAKRRQEELDRERQVIERAKNTPPIVIKLPEVGGTPANPNGSSGIEPTAVPPPKHTLTAEQAEKLTQVKVQLTTIESGASAVNSRIDSMKQQQASMGIVMRADVTEHQTDMNSSISQARQAIKAENPDEAAIFANKAKDDLDYIKRWQAGRL